MCTRANALLQHLDNISFYPALSSHTSSFSLPSVPVCSYPLPSILSMALASSPDFAAVFSSPYRLLALTPPPSISQFLHHWMIILRKTFCDCAMLRAFHLSITSMTVHHHTPAALPGSSSSPSSSASSPLSPSVEVSALLLFPHFPQNL